jgi:hypothetical protein
MKMTPLIIVASLAAPVEAYCAQSFRCKTLDAVEATESGRFDRTGTTAFLQKTFASVVADTRSGAIKLQDLETQDWIIEQTKVDGDWDFVATSAKSTPGRRVAMDTFRLRVPTVGAKSASFVLTYNGFVFISGTCEPLY